MKIISKILAAAIILSMLILPGCSGKSSSGVMIYEAYTSGGYFSGEVYAPYRNCYVVLYNSSKEEVDLTDWSIRFCKSGSSSSESDRTAKLEGKIPADGFFTVRGGIASDTVSPAVGDDLVFKSNIKSENLKLDRKSGVIALCNPKAGSKREVKPNSSYVEDYLAYCDADEETKLFEGRGPARDISVKKILRRKSFTDTNDNAADFETKNIVDKPYHIVRYVSTMKSADVQNLTQRPAPTITASQKSGFYNSEFSLTLTSTGLEGDTKIYYTLDGSPPITPTGIVSAKAQIYDEKKPIRIFDRTKEPTNMMNVKGIQSDGHNDPVTSWPPLKNEGESETAYQKRLNDLYTSVFKGNVVRAAAVNDGNVITSTLSNTYFVSKEDLGKRYGMDIISIMIDRDELYDPERGIYMYKNIENRDDAYKRPALLQYFEQDGKIAFEEPFAFGLNGGFTRIFPQKAIRVNMSNDSFDYDLFDGANKNQEGKTITYYDRFILRAGGNDWKGGGIRDVFFQAFCSKLGSFETQAGKPVTTFLNGEYWGTYWMIERQDKYYINSHFGVPLENVTIVEGFFSLQEGISPDEDELRLLRTYILENDMSTPENYKKFTDVIDLDSYIDYFICELYCGNTDWPHNNLKLWKDRNKASGTNQKWRLMMQDTDFGFHSVKGPDNDPIEWIMKYSGQDNARMFTNLLANKDFKTKFIARFEEMLDTVFVKDEMVKVLRATMKEFEPAASEHYNRWNMPVESFHGTFDYISDFISKRNKTCKDGLAKIK